ncbi:hypothetical protein QR680_009254 [Steinernema hermaphroditum]|uniref:Tetratricopeptide repeat protein n=1 Tax=Steinernema hermaphroditum TaxID=289476 RepID=A0AA39ILQ2_9BILA|nr:hypothetical protein QR680_009254 [Steinernema hermaphroditum]
MPASGYRRIRRSRRSTASTPPAAHRFCFVSLVKENSEAAQRAVVKGVQRMKDKQSLGALQAFNEALGYDDSCCDAYVARAAALANDGKYEPAVSDLEKALNINSEHQNARRYIVATLLAWANSLKENGDMKGARDKFARVLTYEEDATAQKAIEELDVKSHAVKRRVTASKGTLQGQNGKSCQAKRLRVENAAKLKEMEEFIARLKK